MPNEISSPFNLLNVGANVTYTLDVFGGIRRQIEAARAQSEYQQFQLETTYLTLTADVVPAAIQEASLRGQIAATVALISDERDQFDLGGASQADVMGQQTTLAQTDATLPPLKKQLETERDLLRHLSGHFAGDGVGENFDLSEIVWPQNLPLSLPSQLVEQRPEARQYRALLNVANAEVGVAPAYMLPQFTISGGRGTYAVARVNPAILAWDAAAGVAQPIFEGDALLHRRRAVIEAYNQALAEYQYTVLIAFQNVANPLQAVETDAYTLKADAIAERSASELARDQYQAGYILYLSLLVAENSYQRTVMSLVQGEASRHADIVALFQALGGGWWNRSDVIASKRTHRGWREMLP